MGVKDFEPFIMDFTRYITKKFKYYVANFEEVSPG